jgi:hypothetical protein
VGATELSHIELNGGLGTELTVAPGQDVKIKANWVDKNPCTKCRDFVATAFAGSPAAGCFEPGQNAGEGGTAEVDLGPAPKAPGTYDVVAQFEEVFHCGQAWNASKSTGYQVIARVTVLRVPTNKKQCKKGGWRELTDSNGRPFKNQGQCVRFVRHHTRSHLGGPALAVGSPGASPALAEASEGAQKAPLYGPFGHGGIICATGGTATPETFGFAVLNTPGDETTLTGEVALKHAAPNATYEVEVGGAEASGFCIFVPPVGDITTNKEGNGNFHFTVARNPAASKFFVEVGNISAVESFISPAVELD